MRSVFHKFFGRGGHDGASSRNTLTVDLADEGVPRYPPFANGLPIAPVEKVLASQADLIERIRSTLGYTREDFERLVAPVLHRYAAFVHLLPASEAHHHRGAGGLFRHGLEVAFWAAQASEAVIFSIESTPQERRNNEPRWRLASCFSGLLHDAGKPLSDVSITDKEGNKIWNPYAETLVEWAARYRVRRYFIRWRSKRHKRHEQFSLLTIERILTQDVLEYLSETGPQIIEAMLEAIAGTSVNQPVTKLMLRADQESVSRDMRQSRLAVDEFAYGVPVERYVFDAIRRLINSGQWRVNEPGARVWHLHQGVFIAWKQGINDLYELVQQDKIPGIPRDPDTLADILIERGFALPNRVKEEGEGAYYRYWEVLPKPHQEGEVSAHVKLLMLRLESSELVFTTEPPVPVAGEVVGEAEEAEIAFADPAASDMLAGGKAEGADQATSRGIGDMLGQLQAATGQPSLDGDSDSPKSAQNASAKGTKYEFAPAQTIRKASADAAKQKHPADAIPALQEEAGFASTPEQKAKASASLVKGPPPAADKPSLLTQNNPSELMFFGGEPGVPRPDKAGAGAKAALDRLLATLSDARPLLEQAIMPVLEGRQTLGEVLCLVEGKAVILYPEGARSLGAPAEVLATLSKAGAIVPDAIMPGRKVRDFNGIKALAFSDELSSAVVAAIRATESSLDPYQDMPALIKKSQQEKPRKADDKAKPQNQSKAELAAPEPALVNAEPNQGPAVQPARAKRAPQKGAMDKPKAKERRKAARASETQNLARLPKGEEPDRPKPHNVNAQEEPKGFVPVEREPNTMPVNEASFLPPKITPEKALHMLKEMIQKRSGRWLVTPVLEEAGFLVTSDKALEKVASEYPELLSKHALRGLIGLDRSKPLLRIRQGKLALKVDQP